MRYCSEKYNINKVVYNPFNTVAGCREFILYFQTVQIQIRGLLNRSPLIRDLTI